MKRSRLSGIPSLLLVAVIAGQFLLGTALWADGGALAETAVPPGFSEQLGDDEVKGVALEAFAVSQGLALTRDRSDGTTRHPWPRVVPDVHATGPPR